MAVTAGFFVSIGNAVAALASKIQTGQTAKKAAFDVALEKLLAACDATSFYIRMLDRTGRVDDDKEEQLSGLWRAASIAFRRIDNTVADTCLLKGSYWLDPTKWTEKQIKDREIGIESVTKTARALFRSES